MPPQISSGPASGALTRSFGPYALAALLLLASAVSAAAQTRIVMQGVVREDSTQAPVIGAQVTITDVGRGAVTDSLGRFEVPDVPVGPRTVRIQRLGYTPLQVVVDVMAEMPVQYAFLLDPTPTLVEGVTVTSARVPARLRHFEERRMRGRGYFLTPAQLDRHGDRPLSQILRRSVPGLRMVPSHGGGVYLASGKIQAPNPFMVPPRPCYVQIFLDGTRIYGLSPGSSIPPPDLDGFLTRSIEALEFYSGPAMTPPEFRTHTAQCGTLALWSRAA